jgi:hypothetical protein
MRKSVIILSVAALGFTAVFAKLLKGESIPLQAAAPSVSLASFPLEFIPNQGQADPRARFYARTPQYTLWLTDEGLVFDAERVEPQGEGWGRGRRGRDIVRSSSGAAARDVTRLDFIGASAAPGLVPVEASSHVVNFITGNDPARWRTGIGTSRAVLYRDLYEGIDLEVYGVEKEVEYDWIVGPGAEPGRIRFAYEGHRNARIDADGDLIVGTAFGDIIHRRPRAYQVVEGRRREVESRFREFETGVFGFEVGSYDSRAALVIDPAVLLYSTYLGGSRQDALYYSIVDASGAVYSGGISGSPDFPMRRSYDRTLSGAYDGLVVKLAPDG